MAWTSVRGSVIAPDYVIRNTKTGRYYVRVTVNGPVWSDLDHGRKFFSAAEARELEETNGGFPDSEIVRASEERSRNMVRTWRSNSGLQSLHNL